MKRFGYIMLIATLGLSQLSAKKADQTAHAPSNELLTAIASLSSEEKVMLLDHLVGEHEALISRGAPLPAMLARPAAAARSNKEDENNQHKEHMEPAKRKFTTLTIAPNATSACFLPEVFSFNNQGKAFMYQSGAIGGLIGLIAAIGIDSYMRTGNNSRSSTLSANFASTCGGLGIGLSIAMLNYYRLKGDRLVDNENGDKYIILRICVV